MSLNFRIQYISSGAVWTPPGTKIFLWLFSSSIFQCSHNCSPVLRSDDSGGNSVFEKISKAFIWPHHVAAVWSPLHKSVNQMLYHASKEYYQKTKLITVDVSSSRETKTPTNLIIPATICCADGNYSFIVSFILSPPAATYLTFDSSLIGLFHPLWNSAMSQPTRSG